MIKWLSMLIRLLFWLPLLGMANTCDVSLEKTEKRDKTHADMSVQAKGHKCISGCANKYQINDIGTPRLKIEMQESFFLKIMQGNGYVEGFALFSYGGWSDKGQIMVLCNANADGDIIYIAPNSEKAMPSHSFVRSDLRELTRHLNVEMLPDFLPKVFDGIEYEYVRARKKDDNTLEITARVYMKTPSLSDGKPNRYQQIVDAFFTFHERFYQ